MSKIQNQYNYTERYQKEHIKRVVVKLNDVTDSDIIDHLNSKEEKNQTYIKRLIREDMSK